MSRCPGGDVWAAPGEGAGHPGSSAETSAAPQRRKNRCCSVGIWPGISFSQFFLIPWTQFTFAKRFCFALFQVGRQALLQIGVNRTTESLMPPQRDPASASYQRCDCSL